MSRIAQKLEEKYNLLFKNYDLEYPLDIIRDRIEFIRRFQRKVLYKLLQRLILRQ